MAALGPMANEKLIGGLSSGRRTHLTNPWVYLKILLLFILSFLDHCALLINPILNQRFSSSNPSDDKDADYIDKNAEIQKILRDLYPDSEEGDVPQNSSSRTFLIIRSWYSPLAEGTTKSPTLSGNFSHQNLKYFDADESTIIYDIDEERLREGIEEKKKVIKNEEKFKGIDLSRK